MYSQPDTGINLVSIATNLKRRMVSQVEKAIGPSSKDTDLLNRSRSTVKPRVGLLYEGDNGTSSQQLLQLRRSGSANIVVTPAREKLHLPKGSRSSNNCSPLARKLKHKQLAQLMHLSMQLLHKPQPAIRLHLTRNRPLSLKLLELLHQHTQLFTGINVSSDARAGDADAEVKRAEQETVDYGHDKFAERVREVREPSFGDYVAENGVYEFAEEVVEVVYIVGVGVNGAAHGGFWRRGAWRWVRCFDWWYCKW